LFNTMPSQFILWKSVPDMPPKKPRKVPCDATGGAINPHDSAGFMDYETAVTVASQGGFHVGFVLTKNDPYFLLDLDDVRDPVTGEWDNRSQQVAALFPGAAMEVSYSGTGMHIYGRCDAERLRTKRRKFENNKF
jgi:primase-polymerase (primpol)-like protein